VTTTHDPARGTSTPPAGKGLAAGASPAPRGLTAAHLAILGAALADAIEYRQPNGDCVACESHADGLCGDHSADLDLADSYFELARRLGIETED
jgi:hypothetical protein